MCSIIKGKIRLYIAPHLRLLPSAALSSQTGPLSSLGSSRPSPHTQTLTCVLIQTLYVYTVCSRRLFFELFALDEYSYKFHLAPKLSASSLSYKDLFLDESTEMVKYIFTTMILLLTFTATYMPLFSNW